MSLSTFGGPNSGKVNPPSRKSDTDLLRPERDKRWRSRIGDCRLDSADDPASRQAHATAPSAGRKPAWHGAAMSRQPRSSADNPMTDAAAYLDEQ
jgi:hypothetical protein